MTYPRISNGDDQRWGGNDTAPTQAPPYPNHSTYPWHPESHGPPHEQAYDRDSYPVQPPVHNHRPSHHHPGPIHTSAPPPNLRHQPYGDGSYSPIGDAKDPKLLPIKKRRYLTDEGMDDLAAQPGPRGTPTSLDNRKYHPSYHGMQESSAPSYAPAHPPPTEMRHDNYYYESRDDIGEYYDESRNPRSSLSTDRAPPPMDHHHTYEAPRKYSPEEDPSYYNRKRYPDDRYMHNSSNCNYEDRGMRAEVRDDPYSGYAHGPGNDAGGREQAHGYEGPPPRQLILFSLPEDKDWLSERHCFIRQNFVELFEASRNDVASRHSKGAQKLYVGQVGIRCIFCHSLPQKDRAERAVCYPSSVSRIYQTVADMQRFHFDTCRMIPEDMTKKLRSTKKTRSQCERSPQQYWIDSAKAIGLIDSQQGIRFCCPPRISYRSAQP
eukprot:CAMPEP_0194331794 /NCGR_PEP_ID=MMETSP0171-20130528/56952_1 /TAXON_ID=218684 /ORGANISM="Corethron pennatum, Strain L29A3" /LENGTH=434 /DNA_ID=CAMNT_0039093415 /DNA_START=15 /DNA_END=1316 /DNA_ORIENTATION=-